MRHGFADRQAGGDAPEPRRAIVAPAHHGRAVGTERDGIDLARMGQGPAKGLARGGIPQTGRLIPTSGDDRLAVGAERHGYHPMLMS